MVSGKSLRRVMYGCALLSIVLTVFIADERQRFIPSQIQRKATNKPDDPESDTNVLVVIISDRKDGIIPTIASILTTSSSPVDVVLIGRHAINNDVRRHFGRRIHKFTSLSVQDVTTDLVKAGHNPIWTWPDWHTSINNPEWHTEHTLHVGPWDNLHTHAHELNHVRFYLPHLSIFRNKKYFYFLDDDLLVRKDLSVLANQTMAEMGNDKGLVGPCNIWMWNADCFHFEFQSQEDYILEMPSLYGDREVCKTESESHCVPENYWDFVNGQMPANGKEQHAWNFGFSLFALENWRSLDLTAKYEKVMKESYRLHVFPETSLTFGLGVAYIAFAGAVECWNEKHIHVRDGFGFIELDRFEQTFGKNFLETTVDVMHFTGPDKPWVPESRIEPWAVQPWLDMMKQEKMPLPRQLPEHPTDNLFVVLASEFTGVDYILSKLDQHPEICASGEMDKPETGLPVDSLHPNGLDWFPPCSTKKGCTFAFVNESVSELLSTVSSENAVPRRCTKDYDATASKDVLLNHLPRFCNFADQLGYKYNGGKLAQLWVDAFVAEDRTLLGCGCNRGTKAKGLKVSPEWISARSDTLGPQLNLSSSKVHGSKIIRLNRKNLWARYKSMMIAIETGIFNVASPAEKRTQLEALANAGNLTLNIQHLDWHMANMQKLDETGDQWARDHASDILWLEYEDCMEDTTSCFDQIYKFIGVDKSRLSKSKLDLHAAMISAYYDVDDSMAYVANAGEIREKMALHGWGHFISNEHHRPIQLLLYNENEMLVDTRHYLGMNTTVFGHDKKGKFAGAMSLLREMSPETMVVLGDLSSAWVNFPLGGYSVSILSLATFRSSFEDLTHDYPGAVAVSAEVQCCSSSLSHVAPGDLIDVDNKRAARSCLSSEKGCEWKDAGNEFAWRSLMTSLAEHRSSTSGRYFLDAGLMAGKASDMLSLLELADIRNTEDDRAVLTDALYRNSSMFVLDYDQKLFGESALALKKGLKNACTHDTSSNTAEARRLDDVNTNPTALFMRTPRSFGCKRSDIGSTSAPSFPSWGGEGIKINSVTDHIDRVMAMEDTVVLRTDYRQTDSKINYRQGPEIPYFMDDSGVWSSRLIRGRTDNVTFFQRLLHSEKLTLRAHNLLMSEAIDTPRWPALKRYVRAGGLPYWSWYGDFKICNLHNHKLESIPVFTTCAKVDCNYAFPMPTYMTEIDAQESDSNWRGFFRESERDFPWTSKIRKAVWRGSLSEADGDKTYTNIRWRAAKHIHEQKSVMYDFGLTHIPSWVQGDREIDVRPVGGLKQGISPMNEFQRHLAILDMDGNSWSSRFGTLLCYNSVVIKIEAQFVEYFYSQLKPWVHYIPVKDDLSDLDQNVAWALDPVNDKAVRNIITAANQWCSKSLVPEEIARDVLDVMESYVGQLDRADPKWQQTWIQKREQISSPLSSFDVVQIQ